MTIDVTRPIAAAAEDRSGVFSAAARTDSAELLALAQQRGEADLEALFLGDGEGVGSALAGQRAASHGQTNEWGHSVWKSDAVVAAPEGGLDELAAVVPMVDQVAAGPQQAMGGGLTL